MPSSGHEVGELLQNYKSSSRSSAASVLQRRLVAVTCRAKHFGEDRPKNASCSRSLDALLFVESSCPPFSRSVVRVSRDHSVVGAQRPGVRVGAVVELGQDPIIQLKISMSS